MRSTSSQVIQDYENYKGVIFNTKEQARALKAVLKGKGRFALCSVKPRSFLGQLARDAKTNADLLF